MKKKDKKSFLDLSIFSVRITYLSIIIAICTLMAIIKPVTLYVAFIIIILLTATIIYLSIKELKERKDRISEISKSVDTVLKDSLNTVDIPMVMLTTPTQIIWQNKACEHIIPKEFIHDVALKIEKLKKQNDTVVSATDIGNGEYYSAIGNYIHFSKFNCMLISFLNKTKEINLQETLDNSKVSVGIIFIDNYEETMQGLDDIKKAEITSKIATQLNDFVTENKGVLTKIDKDRFVVFIEKQYVNEMEKNTFKIF